MLVEIPPVRRLFIPKPGYMLFEADLKRADPQIVAKESGEIALLKVFRENIDVYTENAKWVYNKSHITQDERQWNKNGVNAVDYACKANTLGNTLHVSKDRAQQYIDRWLGKSGMYPGIGRWHRNVDRQLRDTKTVKNIYGYRRYYTDRITNLLPQALAWIASSTVSVTINRGMLAIYEQLPAIELLLQIHDSVLGQIPIDRAEELLPKIVKLMEVEIPYPDPLVIPVTLKVSEKNWGDCEQWTAAA